MTYEELVIFLNGFINETFDFSDIVQAYDQDSPLLTKYSMINASEDLKISTEETCYEHKSEVFNMHFIILDAPNIELAFSDYVENEHVKKLINIQVNKKAGIFSITLQNLSHDPNGHSLTKDSIITFNIGDEKGILSFRDESKEVSLNSVLDAIKEMNVTRFFGHFAPQKLPESQGE